MRFWLDGAEIGTLVPDSTGTTARWAFPGGYLSGENWHSLHASAVDQSGRTTFSNVVRIKGAPAVGMETVYTIQAGDTLASVAAKFEADPAKVQARNSGLTGTGADALPAGQGLIIPFDAPAASVAPMTIPPAPQVAFTTKLPKPPTMLVTAEQCTVKITLQELAQGANGFVLYRLDGNNDIFSPLASFKPGQAGPLVFEDKSASGAVQYAASVYNAEGETLGKPTPLSLSAPGCSSAANNGSTLRVTGNLLSLPPVSSPIYFYQNTGGNVYDRFPLTNFQFVSPGNGTVDLNQIGAAEGVRKPLSAADLEVWTWDKGKLDMLGLAESTASLDSSLLVCPWGKSCGGNEGTAYSTSAFIDYTATKQVNTFKSLVSAKSG